MLKVFPFGLLMLLKLADVESAHFLPKSKAIVLPFLLKLAAVEVLIFDQKVRL